MNDDILKVEINQGFDPVTYYDVWPLFGQHPISGRFRHRSEAEKFIAENGFYLVEN